MTLAFAEGNLRATCDPRDAAYADVIAGILTSRGEDIPLPEGSASSNEGTALEVAPITPGRIALFTGIEVPAESADSLDEAYTKRTKLSAVATELAQPYADAINANLLIASRPTRFQRLMGEKYYKQSISKTVGSRVVDYEFNTSYEERGNNTSADGFAMTFGRASYLGLGFQAGGLETIKIVIADGGDIINYISKGSDTSVFNQIIDMLPDETVHGGGTRKMRSSIAIGLGYEQLGIKLENAPHGHDHDEGRHFSSSFIYVPENDRFEERYVRGPKPPQHTRTFENDDYLALIQTALRSIPTGASEVLV